MNEGKRSCLMMWFSGFFGLGFVAHTLRFIFRVPVTLGTHVIPLSASVLLMIVFGALSAVFYSLAAKTQIA